MPTKKLPPSPHFDLLKQLAKELLADAALQRPGACQRLREFHPKFSTATDAEIAKVPLKWSDALFTIAREFGFASWPRLRRHVLAASADEQRSYTDRIVDPSLKLAVQAIEDGNIERLAALLDAQPDLVARRAEFEGENYFRNPSLLAFIAENPVRTDSLPPNAVEIAQLLLRRGTSQADINETLGLVATGRVPREAGLQGPLIELLCSAGAEPDGPMIAALAHGEFAAVETLLKCGADRTAGVAAVLDSPEALAARIQTSDPEQLQIAVALAAQHGRTDAVRMLLEQGIDPNRYNPVGVHAHSTPLHQAALYGHENTVRLLLEHGANTEMRDTQWDGTPVDWARYAGKRRILAIFENRTAE